MKKFVIGYYRKCDLLTLTGVCIAFAGIILSIKLHFLFATLSMILCGICDAFDGKLARKYNYEKNAKVYGVELDSLADVICSGVFPAILTVMQSQYIITYIISAFYILCGVIRLAYFNTLAADESAEKNVYIGVPITTITIAYPSIMLITRLINKAAVPYVMPALLLLLAIAYILKIRIKKPDISKILGKIFSPKVINFFLFPLFILIISDIYFKFNFSGNIIYAFFNTVKNNFGAFVLMLAVISAAFCVITCVFGNTKRAKIFSMIVTVLLLTINDIKYSIMGLPLQFSDVNYLNPDNITMIGTSAGSIGSWIIKVIIKSLVLIILFLAFIIFDKGKMVIKFKKVRNRIIALVLAIVILSAPLLTALAGSDALLAVYGFNREELNSLSQIDETYYETGFYQGMFLNGVSSNYIEPSGYDSEEIDEVVSKIGNNTSQGVWGKANVVFILSEAFSDVQNMPEVEFKSSITPNLDSFENDSNKMVFDLLVPTIGGASVNTEFEILTGSALSLWPTSFIPYNSYYNDSNGRLAPNIIKEFNDNGYETLYLTPWGRDSYRSEYIYTLFGADEKIYGDNLNGKSKGWYYSDDSLMDDIFNQLKDTTEGNYKFIMAATAENHFPYDANRFPITDVVANSEKLNKEQLGMISSYAQGIYDADKALGKLYKKIQTLDVPTIIVFYGDHLPHIVDSKGNKPYIESEYFNTENQGLNYMRTYTTKAAILANFDLDTSDDFDYINASYLGAYVLNKLNLNISDYFKFIDSSRSQLPVFNKNCAFLDGGTVELENLSDEQAALLKNLSFARYRWFYDFKN